MRFALLAFLTAALSAAQTDKILDRMTGESEHFAKLSRQIWEWAEMGYEEKRSSALLEAELRNAGFRVAAGVAGMPTAFTAEWGQGKPVIVIMGEYDALPALSQEAIPERKPVVEGQPGHGCGHNLFGVAAAHAAIAVKRELESRKLPGTIRFYGTPAEEGGGGKIHMIRAGLFKDVDAALTWHPWDRTFATNQTWLSTVTARVRFTGRASHAAAAPEAGRSALDAAMIMTHAVDLMREHVPQETRMHYALERAGAAVNIVPAETEVVMMARHPDASVLAGIWERLQNCARAGALATGTEVKWEVTGNYASTIPNLPLTKALDANLNRVGGYKYTPEEEAFATAIRATLPSTSNPPPPDAHTRILPVQEGVLPASTDVGDVSWVVPTAQIQTATWVPGTPAHTWQSTATSGMSIGQKGMVLAAKTLALTALDLLTNAKLVEAARADFDGRMKGREYRSLHPAAIKMR